MNLVYMNYASTSYKKFTPTITKLTEILNTNSHINAGRNLASIDDIDNIFVTRMQIADFFGADRPQNVIFTSGITLSLNMILSGLLKPDDHVAISSIEHNSVLRPLAHLKTSLPIRMSLFKCTEQGEVYDPESVVDSFRPNTKALVMSHASNVLGTILPIRECFAYAKQRGVITILDSAQTAGYLPISMKKMNIDILAFTGHKSLMGLAGIGGFVLSDEMAELIDPTICGGTGSISISPTQPDFLPDKFEPGTPNSLGIASLSSSISQITQIGLPNIKKAEEKLTRRFINGLKKLPVTVYGTMDAKKSVPTVSINIPGLDPAIFSQMLFDQFKIVTRSGLHCSPLAHDTAKTMPIGTVRFSFGYYTTEEEIDYALDAIKQISKECASLK